MRILVICPHFDPDPAPTGVVISEIVRNLVDRGHEVEIVTSLPWYRNHDVEPGWSGRLWRTERTTWGRVTRVHPFPGNKSNLVSRAAGFAGFTALAGLAGLFRRRRPDVVLTMSPPLTLGLVGWLVARIRRAPFVFNVQDIFPDVAVEVGAITNRRVIGLLSWLERFVYRRADAVTVLSEDLAENVAAKIGTADRVRVIANFVDTDRLHPGPSDTPYRAALNAGDRTVVMYAGNLGFSQPLELVVETARRWDGIYNDVLFVINGGGSARPALERSVDGLDSVRFVDFQPAERLNEVLASADIHLVLLRTGLARSSVPSKMYSILAAGRPVLASVDSGTEVARVVTEHHCGVAVPPEDIDAFAEALRTMLDDPERGREMGQRGRKFVETWVSPAGVAAMYESLFLELRREIA
jgi:colanic acid biosynthesis glycosyl transferase WcaI